MALTALELVRDNINGVAVGLNASGYVLSRSLAANTAESMTVPTGGKVCELFGNGEYLCEFHYHGNRTRRCNQRIGKRAESWVQEPGRGIGYLHNRPRSLCRNR